MPKTSNLDKLPVNNTVKPSIPDVLSKFISYYEKPENGAWGSLHIVLDDGNIEDSSVNFCIKWAHDNNDPAGKELGELLLKMSKSQRMRLPDKVREAVRSKRNG